MKKAFTLLLGVLSLGFVVLVALVAFEFFVPSETVSFLSPPKPFVRENAVPEIWTKDIMGEKELVDGKSRVLFFRGINLKIKKGEEADLHVLEDAKDAGINVINLVVSWKDLEPSPLKIDLDFVFRLREIVREAGGLGFKVMLSSDMFLGNQNVLDALPSFAVRRKRFGLSPDRFWKLRFYKDFFFNEYAPDNMTLQDHLISVFVKLAETFQREQNLLGYSPFLSFQCPSSFIQKTFFGSIQTCSNALLDFYERFGTALRAKDWDAIMFFAVPEGVNDVDFRGLENAVFLTTPIDLYKGRSYFGLRPLGIYVSKEAQQKFGTEKILDLGESLSASLIFFESAENDKCSVYRFSRPYPQSVSGGMPRFSVKDNSFSLRFLETGNLFESKVFVPSHWFEREEKSDAPPFVVDVSDGMTKLEKNIVTYKHRTTSPEHTLVIKRWGNRPVPDPKRICNEF